VIVNLAVNARDAMPNGGELTIRTRNVGVEESKSFEHREMTPGEYVLAEIEDTGTGIPANVIEKIFEPFFTTKEVGKGTGLGLSMAAGIIKQPGAFIYGDRVVGRGTVFRISLPRYAPAAQPVTEAAQAAAPATAVTRGQVSAPPKPQPEPARDLSGSATV